MMTIQRLDRTYDFDFNVDQAKEHMRVVGDHDNFAIRDYCNAAAIELEDAAEIALINQPIRLVVYGWPSDNILRLPIRPAAPDSEAFQVTRDDEPVEGELISGNRPLAFLDDFNTEALSDRFTVEYQAGFGATLASVPPDIIHAILDQAALLYDHRAANPHEAKTPQARGGSGLCYAMMRVVGRYRGVRA